MTTEQHNIAWNEGWCIANTSTQDATHNLWELQTVSENGIFKDDNDAVEFVVRKAEADNKSLHADALNFLLTESPNEMDSFIRGVIGEERYNSLLDKLS